MRRSVGLFWEASGKSKDVYSPLSGRVEVFYFVADCRLLARAERLRLLECRGITLLTCRRSASCQHVQLPLQLLDSVLSSRIMEPFTPAHGTLFLGYRDTLHGSNEGGGRERRSGRSRHDMGLTPGSG